MLNLHISLAHGEQAWAGFTQHTKQVYVSSHTLSWARDQDSEDTSTNEIG